MSRWIIDTGPLIFLAKLDRLNLLQQGADEVLIPVAVLNEVRALRDEATRKIEIATQITPNRHEELNLGAFLFALHLENNGHRCSNIGGKANPI